MPVNKVEVHGLADFRRDLRAANKKAPKAFQQTNKKVANNVADKVRSKYSARYLKTGRGAKTIRALASATKAQVALGSVGAPYVVGQNFGSTRYRQFPPKATPDHFLYATIEEEMPGIHDDYLDILMDTLDEAFPGAR